MVEKQHQFFDLVQRLSNQTLVVPAKFTVFKINRRYTYVSDSELGNKKDIYTLNYHKSLVAVRGILF